MITKSELEKYAKKYEIKVPDVQRDYVFGWFLYGLFTFSDLKDQIFLKGGNALRKGYFENTRYSSDIDLGVPNDIDENRLKDEIRKICDHIKNEAQIEFINSDIEVKEKFNASESPLPDLKVFEAKVYFKDFYGNPEHFRIKLSMDITRFDKVLLPIQKVDLIHPYSDAAKVKCKIQCMKLEEIIATKMKCLIQRQHVPDLFDYVFSVKLLGGNLDKEEVVKTFIQKTIFYKNPHIAKDILCNSSFKYFKRFWKVGIVCAKAVFMEIEETIDYFVTDVKQLFDIYPDNNYNQFTFFSADMRIPIMEAGRTQTLLKIKYKDADRIVEPYSLKYLQKKNGLQREYFYVYNVSGGSSAPRVRSLIANNLQNIENTDQKFEPRFQIELSKSGETPENPYIFDPNRPISSPKRSSVTGFKQRRSRSQYSSYGPKYVFKCSTCGKRFYRKTQNTSMKTHKNKSGFPCYGYAVYVGTKY